MAAPKDDQALPDPSPRDMLLPPTPPEDYSDENKNRLQTPPMQTLQQLLTPDNTPPGMVLQPPRPLLSRDPSSRADSFRTAREELSREFLRAVDEADSQVEDEESSEDESVHNGEDDSPDEEPWRDIPGAFRSTPSTTSSRNVEEPDQSLGPMSSPSTGSSDKFVRPKQYLDIESPPSTGSSRNIERTRRYRHDTESPSDRHKASEDGHVNGSASYAHSVRSLEEDSDDSDADEQDGEDTHEERDNVSAGHNFNHEAKSRHEWDDHVSYLALGVKEHEDAIASARGSPSSSRLSGNGRRMGVNDAQPIKGVNNPPLATSAIVAEQGLLKRASDESSHQRSDDTPSPSVSAQKRKQRLAATSKEAATPREARELHRILRSQHAGTDIPAEFLATPPRDANDTVYKHIQQANMDRFDAMKNGHAVEAVVVSADSARNRHLRHVTKRQSLRSVSDNNSSYMPSSGLKRESSLRPKKALTPQKVPQKAPQPSSPESPHNTRSVSGSHSLRHEKRPLSGTGRPLQSNDNSPALPRTKEPLTLRHKPPFISKEPPRLRHSSLPIHLNSEPSQVSPTSLDSAKSERRRAHALRRSSREYRIENAPSTVEPVAEQKPVSTIIETTTFTSPHLLGLGTQTRSRSRGTPLSVSAVSDRTEMEVCEAQNVAFYPHSNNSLLLVQHRTKPEQKTNDEVSSSLKTSESRRLSNGDGAMRLSLLFPPAEVQDTPPSIAVNGKSIHTVESPLTNPRAAPMPPVINFIPATPSHEDEEKQLVPTEEEEMPSTPQRRNSLAKRARRYSEVVVRPLFGRTLVTRSHNIRPSPTASEKRDERLHPNWVPNSFWQDDDDDDEYYSDPEDSFVRLPAGGDTSEHPKSKFPRSMSVRMPGFRGSGGFLLGNSLGVDRHGTNKRRHYIEPPSGNGSASASRQSVRRVASLDSMASHASGDGRIFVIPGTRTRLQYVGFKPIKDKIKKRRETREDAAREKRRAEIKDQIGMRIVHDA